MVRKEMALGDGWRELVPDEVADYIVTRHLDDRFRREVGLEAMALDIVVKTRRHKNVFVG